MSYPVRYYCPHCGAVVELERDGYLSDKSVTPYPLVGWEYADPAESFENDDADGVHFVCGESDAEGLRWTGEVSEADDVEHPGLESPCGNDVYLSFVRFEDGREVDPVPESEYVDIGSGPRSGPRGPNGP
ncbi:hypothetical protein NDI76_11000 [Halogeometricum sp. S1BR25-6]|uniref:DUF7969 domain-containing protein n=1 Tax=Halogeometricum salsisoli TaxID=2950536 RepID=A0ABU2GEN4_9EURY|nr:hypothetical protein [Halogeometricum sp. S1BR25-6]MDS0299267.1 hypothetical protein [Halogeometricum sp. S1BR25-6]